MDGPISGPFGLTQTGAGMLILTASNSYTGPTVVNGGTISVGNGGTGASIGATSGVTLGANGTLLFNFADSQALGTPISGAGNVVVALSGTGQLNLTASNSYSGRTTVNGGALELSQSGALSPNSAVTVNAGGALLLNASAGFGASPGTGSLTVNSGGVVVALPGYRTPLWNTVNLNGGVLVSEGGNGDGNGNYSLSGQINATGVNGPSNIAAAQVSLLNTTVFNITRGNTPAPDLVVTSEISSLPSGNGLILQGNGLTVFTGANTYDGGTSVTGGTLQLNNNAALGTGGLAVSAGALVDVNGSSPSIGVLNGNGVIDNVTAGGTPVLTIGNGTASGTFSGTIQNTSGALTLATAGSGTQYLTGTNTYSGGTQLNGGVLNFVPSALPSANSSSITFGGGTLQWAAGNTEDVSAAIAPIPSGVQAGIDTNGNSVSFATGLSGSGGVTKAGAGTLALTVPNSYTGPTSIVGGTLVVADPAGVALQNSTVNVNVNNGLAFSVPAATIGGLSGPGSFNLGATALSVGGNNSNSTYTGTMSGAGSLTMIGSGMLTLAASQAYSGPTSLVSGTIRLAVPATPLLSGFGGNGTGWTTNQSGLYPSVPTPITSNVLTLTDNSGSQGRSAFYNTPVPASASFTANFVYTDANEGGADGVTFILQNQGLSALGGNGGSFGYGPNGVAITPSVGIYLNLYNSVNQVGFVSGGTVGAANATGNVNLHSGDPIDVSVSYYAASQILGVTLTDPLQNESFSTSESGVNLASMLGGSSAWVGFTGADGGVASTQTISDFSFSLPGSNTMNILPVTSALSLSGGTLDLFGTNQTVASLSGNGAVTNNNPYTTATLTTGGDNSSQIYYGVLQDGAGSLGLIKVGSGNLTLVGTNVYSGGTTISGGTLQLGTGSFGQDGSIGGATVVDNAALVYAIAGSQTAAYAISGNGSVAMVGPGLVVLTASNTYTGATTISNGTLQLGTGAAGSDGALAGTSGVTDNAVLAYAIAGSQTASYAIGGSGAVVSAATAYCSSRAPIRTVAAPRSPPARCNSPILLPCRRRAR